MRQAADKKPKTTKSGKKVAAAPQTLESLGLDPNVIAKLRADGKTDAQLILLLRKAGLVK
jgi:uncharacterized protein (DUF4415 family)